jgi:hypothetical protein
MRIPFTRDDRAVDHPRIPRPRGHRQRKDRDEREEHEAERQGADEGLREDALRPRSGTVAFPPACAGTVSREKRKIRPPNNNSVVAPSATNMSRQ